MEKLFKELAWKCYENDLAFDFSHHVNQVRIYKILVVGDEIEYITEGYIKNWEWEAPVDALERMHKELDEYLEIEQMADEEFICDRPRGVSSDESKMKEAGHKQSDFI